MSAPKKLTYVQVHKKDPSNKDIKVRDVELPCAVNKGPSDAMIRIIIRGMDPIQPTENPDGSLSLLPENEVEFDAIHTYSVVRMTLDMYRRALLVGQELPDLNWAWCSKEPIEVYPHYGLVADVNEINAKYIRKDKVLVFQFYEKVKGSNWPPHDVYTCRALDVVAHETGHAILDGLKPGWLQLGFPETRALHESFGDLTAIFLMLTQHDLLDLTIVNTKANLLERSFLCRIGEQVGISSCLENSCLRDASNTKKMSDVDLEEHRLSQVFTGAVYHILADMFKLNRDHALGEYNNTCDDVKVLNDTAAELCRILLQAIKQAPCEGASFVDVASRMMSVAEDTARRGGNGKAIAKFIKDRFAAREVYIGGAMQSETVSEQERFLENQNVETAVDETAEESQTSEAAEDKEVDHSDDPGHLGRAGQQESDVMLSNQSRAWFCATMRMLDD